MGKHRKLLRRSGILRPLLAPFFSWRFQHTYSVPDELPEHFLLLSNHEADYDPFMLYIAFKNRFIYFFMSEHLLRQPVVGSLARFINDPIPTMRHVADTHAVRTALAILRKGGSVGLYPAGEREWDGHELPIGSSIGKFVKATKAPLVTFNIKGMYFVQPRWGRFMRHFPTHGEVVGIYDTDTLAAMTPEEVTALVRHDLSVDSDAWRATIPQATRGRRRAEWLEQALYLCPRCQRINTLHSHDDVLACDCGFSVRYTEYDVFDEGAPFPTVHDWNVWQKDRLAERVDRKGDAVVLSDEDIELLAVTPAVGQETITRGTLVFSGKGLSCGQWQCAFDDIQGLGLVGKRKIIFAVDNKHYELRGTSPWNIMKYGDLYRYLKKEG